MLIGALRKASACLLGAALCAWPGRVAAQATTSAPESPLLWALRRDVAAQGGAAVERFWQAVAARRTPLVDSLPNDANHVLATFVFRGATDTRDVVLVAGPNGIDPFTDPRSHMRHLAGTDVWYASHRLAADAEFFYQFSVNPPAFEGEPQPALLRSTLAPDPLNPLQYPEPGDPLAAAGHGSIARMPAVPPNPWLARRPGVAAGTVRSDTLASSHLRGARRLWAYASPGAALHDANVLIVFDGGVYVKRIPTPTILDNLYEERKIGPTVAVFVDNGGSARARDYYFSDAYTAFLTDELLPWIQRQYGVVATPERTVLAGSSLGGLAAAYAVMRRPDAFGKALSESGAFWAPGRDTADSEPEWLAREIARAPVSGAYFYLEVGSYESAIANETTLLASNRHLRDILQLKGYRYAYREIPGDHEPINWRRGLPDGLIATLGR